LGKSKPEGTFDIDEIYEKEKPLFEIQAYLNLSKHIGGTKATDELVQACNHEGF
jgi:hypothetical protein